MKRPEITIRQRNTLLNLVLGSGWIISAALRLLESSNPLFHHLDAALITVMALLLIYIVTGKHEKNDEMAVAHKNEAYAYGFLAACITILVLLTLDNLFIDGGIPFSFAGYFIMGIGNFAAGWKFYMLEKYGD